MAIKTRIKIGDVFAIPLADQRYALGLCLFAFRNFRNCIVCRIFDTVVDSPHMLEPMPLNAVANPLFMGKQIITSGTWPIIGRMAVADTPMLFRVADEKYNGDEYVGPAGNENLPNLEVQGPVAIQNLLRDHFGLML